jgi:hypothetical protein
MNDVLKVLLASMDAAYEKHGWHGTTLRNAVRRVHEAAVYWRPAPGRHNIWELTVHAAYWKYAARRRLLGAVKRGSFPLKGSNWIGSPDGAGQPAWQEAVALLEDQHRALREVVASLGPKTLADPKKVRIVYGVAAHDVYHAGQIQLLKKLYAS